MLTNEHKEQSVAVFLFAHQDDEFGVYEQIHLEQKHGRHVVCAYLTSGMPYGGDSTYRNQESLGVLGQLGVPTQNVVFAGELLGIEDGTLIDSLHPASDWIKSWLNSFSSIDAVFVPAWEGGHPDHDALHAITVQLCSELMIDTSSVVQFSLYNAFRCVGPFFRVLTPLRENGKIISSRISWNHRIRFLRYALSYPSQKKSWLGLFPFLLLHYLILGTQDLQPTSPNRIRERPHDGTLYYEQRRFSSWDRFSTKLINWLATRPIKGRG